MGKVYDRSKWLVIQQTMQKLLSVPALQNEYLQLGELSFKRSGPRIGGPYMISSNGYELKLSGWFSDLNALKFVPRLNRVVFQSIVFLPFEVELFGAFDPFTCDEDIGSVEIKNCAWYNTYSTVVPHINTNWSTPVKYNDYRLSSCFSVSSDKYNRLFVKPCLNDMMLWLHMVNDVPHITGWPTRQSSVEQLKEAEEITKVLLKDPCIKNLKAPVKEAFFFFYNYEGNPPQFKYLFTRRNPDNELTLFFV